MKYRSKLYKNLQFTKVLNVIYQNPEGITKGGTLIFIKAF